VDVLDKLENLSRKKLTRKEFLETCVKAGIALSVSACYFDTILTEKAYGRIATSYGTREASYYEKISDDIVKCLLCPEGCILKNGQRGFCRVREPLNGKLQTLVYGLICARHIDPVEKKPLFHFLPGTKTFSVATAGCNCRCKFCQNWTISQRPPEETRNIKLMPDELVAQALNNSCESISYTYSEPNVSAEYVIDTSKKAREKGIKNITVTGGKINKAPLIDMCRYLDASNVDLKGFDKNYLRDICAQNIDEILRTLIIMKNKGIWVEITNLIVPTLNDDLAVIKKMVRWIRKELGPEVPLHFSRFWPQYKLRYLYPTPVETLKAARDIALSEGLYYVYVGNIPDFSFQSTVCPKCKKVVVKRIGYKVDELFIKDGKCEFCGYEIDGFWT
jgi:pyruvate formate lyase activating enzyme